MRSNRGSGNGLNLRKPPTIIPVPIMIKDKYKIFLLIMAGGLVTGAITTNSTRIGIGTAMPMVSTSSGKGTF